MYLFICVTFFCMYLFSFSSNYFSFFFFFFFFNDTATTEIYTLSLHDALPMLHHHALRHPDAAARLTKAPAQVDVLARAEARSEEHTSELQSHSDLVCRLLL